MTTSVQFEFQLILPPWASVSVCEVEMCIEPVYLPHSLDVKRKWGMCESDTVARGLGEGRKQVAWLPGPLFPWGRRWGKCDTMLYSVDLAF